MFDDPPEEGEEADSVHTGGAEEETHCSSSIGSFLLKYNEDMHDYDIFSVFKKIIA